MIKTLLSHGWSRANIQTRINNVAMICKGSISSVLRIEEFKDEVCKNLKLRIENAMSNIFEV